MVKQPRNDRCGMQRHDQEEPMELNQFFSENQRAALAFSGGVDSAYLLYAAVDAGADVTAYYVKTEFQPQFELDDAIRLAEQLGAKLRVLELSVLEDAAIAANPPERCYSCKKRIFQTIQTAARKDGYSLLLDGTNASDLDADRPGIRALRELGVRSPLREAGLSKAQIRALSRQAGLFTWDKPAYACLATRIPAGEPITPQALRRTEQAEQALAALGLKGFRVRTRNGGALLQVRQADLALVLAHREEIVKRLLENYKTAALDLEVRK